MPSESAGFAVLAWASRCSNFGTIATFSLNGRRLEARMAKYLFDTELKCNEGVYESDMPAQLVMTNALVAV